MERCQINVGQAVGRPGLYEVIAGAQVVYVSADGRYLLQGDLFDTKTEKSLTDPQPPNRSQECDRCHGRKEHDHLFTENKEHTLTVFTDIGCPYCRKLQRNRQLSGQGHRGALHDVPRAGKGSDSYRKAVAVWCSDDRNEALTLSKAGKAIPMKTCDNPIDKHMALANELGLKGTPLLVLDDGTIQATATSRPLPWRSIDDGHQAAQ